MRLVGNPSSLPLLFFFFSLNIFPFSLYNRLWTNCPWLTQSTLALQSLERRQIEVEGLLRQCKYLRSFTLCAVNLYVANVYAYYFLLNGVYSTQLTSWILAPKTIETVLYDIFPTFFQAAANVALRFLMYNCNSIIYTELVKHISLDCT